MTYEISLTKQLQESEDKNWGFQLKRAGGGSRDKEIDQNWSVDRIDQAVDRFDEAENLKSLSRLNFSPISSGSSTLVLF